MHGLLALHHLTVASAHPIFTLGSGTQLTKLNNWRVVYGSLYDLSSYGRASVYMKLEKTGFGNSYVWTSLFVFVQCIPALLYMICFFPIQDGESTTHMLIGRSRQPTCFTGAQLSVSKSVSETSFIQRLCRRGWGIHTVMNMSGELLLWSLVSLFLLCISHCS